MQRFRILFLIHALLNKLYRNYTQNNIYKYYNYIIIISISEETRGLCM
jgi:hypothetical protein